LSLAHFKAARAARNLSPAERLVMISLADHADAQGRAWPSIAEICEELELGKTAVYEALRLLKARGLILDEWKPGIPRAQCFPVTGIRNPESDKRNDSEVSEIPVTGNEIPDSGKKLPVNGKTYKEDESLIESLIESPSLPPSSIAGEPAQKSLALQATGPLEVLRDAWPEFRRRCFRALGIDEHEERKLEASLLLLPGQGHQLLISNWSVLGRGRPGADLLVVADWIVAGALGGQRFKPFWLAKKLDDYLKASAAWDAAGRPSISALMPLPAKPEPLTAATWKAYSEAYEARYRVPPVRNAAVNGQIAQLVKQLGAEEAPQVAAYYLTHNDAFYQAKHHDVGLLVKDCRSLRTQWARGQQMTVTQARRIEQTTANPALEILQDRARQRRGGDV